MLVEHMLKFKPVGVADVSLLRDHINKYPKRICDFTAVSIYMWGDHYSTSYALEGDTLYLRVKYPIGYCYAIICDEAVYAQRAEALYNRCEVECRPLKLCAVTAKEFEAVTAHFGARVSASTLRDWSDYIYLAAEMREFSGKKYHRQKNHINGFVRDNPDWRFEPITADNFKDIVAFYAEHRKKHADESASAMVEAKAVETVLENYDDLGLFGGILYSGEAVVGFSMGEISGDMLFVHIEKASTEFRGSYQMLVREFARAFVTEGVTYINREDDAGDEGLRTSKLSYRPVELIDKYLLAIES